MFASSGSGAMESAVANLVAPGDTPLVASCGKFGQRWAELCDAHGAETIHLETEWGEKIDPDRVDRAARRAPAARSKVVFTTLSETSTGVVNDIRALAEVARDARRDPGRRRGLGPRRRRPADGRVGRRRGRLGLAEGADVAARPRLRRRLRAGDGVGRSGARRAARTPTTSTGRRPARVSCKDPPDSPFTPAVTLIACARRGARADRARDAAEGLRASRDARPRGARGRQGRSASSCSGPRTRAPTSSPRCKAPEGVDGAADPEDRCATPTASRSPAARPT